MHESGWPHDRDNKYPNGCYRHALLNGSKIENELGFLKSINIMSGGHSPLHGDSKSVIVFHVAGLIREEMANKHFFGLSFIYIDVQNGQLRRQL